MKQTLTGNLASHYRQAGKKEKTKILDEFIRRTGYNRKYALYLLTHWGKKTFLTVDGKPVKLKAGTAKRRKGGGRKPVYGPEVIVSLRAFFWDRCGRTEGPQLLAPLLREQMAFFESWPPFHITAEVKAKLLRINPRTRFRGGDHRPGTERRPEKALPPRHQRYQTPGTFLKKHIPVRPLLNKAQKWVMGAFPDIRTSLPLPPFGR
jgi:hypothetical protein